MTVTGEPAGGFQARTTDGPLTGPLSLALRVAVRKMPDYVRA